MSKTSDGTKDQPQFASSGNSPTFAADLTLLADFYAARSFRAFATVTAMKAASGKVTGDFGSATNAPGAVFRYNGSTWDMIGVARFASSAARATALPSPETGWMSRIDTERFDRRWNGSAWRPSGAGFLPIIPTSVTGTGMTLGADGAVTGVGVNPGSANGVFTSDFDNYLMKLRKTNSSTGWMRFKLRAAGTDATTAYDDQRLTGTGTTAAAAQTINQGEWASLVTTPYAQAAIDMELFGPALAAPTFALARMVESSQAGGIGLAQWGGGHRTSTAYDGITFSTNTGTESFTVRFYGLNNE